MLIVATMIVFTRNVHTSFNEKVPTKYLFRPKLERREEVQISSISKGQLSFTKADESFNCLIIVIDVGVSDERVDTIHLHGDFSVYRNVSSENCLTEHAIILRRSRIGQTHTNPLSSIT